VWVETNSIDMLSGFAPQIAFKIKLNKSKRYMVKPYQGVIMGGSQSVVRREYRPEYS
jgi:hypothetical protein